MAEAAEADAVEARLGRLTMIPRVALFKVRQVAEFLEDMKIRPWMWMVMT